MLYIAKLNFKVSLNKKIDHIPSIKMDGMIAANGWGWIYRGSQTSTTAADLKSQLEKNIASTNSFATTKNTPHISVVSGTKSTSSTTSSALPEINISITKQDGFLLITFSPVVTNASLEQADMNSYPWAWQPAITVTNNSATNGWYVDPYLQPRVFRVRIDQ